MAIRNSREQTLQVQGTIENVKVQCINALNTGGFKKITVNNGLNKLSAKFNNFSVVGRLDISLINAGDYVNIHMKTSANVDNVFALASSPHDKIMDSFTNNFQLNIPIAEATEETGTMDKYEQLERMQQLKEKGVLTDEEFIIEKNKILNSEVENRQTTTIQRPQTVTQVSHQKELQSNGAATSGLVLSLIGLFIIPFLFGLIAVILSAVGLSKNRNEYKGHGNATAGLIIGIVDIIWGIFWFQIFAQY